MLASGGVDNVAEHVRRSCSYAHGGIHGTGISPQKHLPGRRHFKSLKNKAGKVSIPMEHPAQQKLFSESMQ
jgi:hypothetical protein